MDTFGSGPPPSAHLFHGNSMSMPAAGRDFFPSASKYNAEVTATQPPAHPGGKRLATGARRHASLIAVLALVAAVAAAGAMVWQRRKRAKETVSDNPYAEAVRSLPPGDHAEDMREWMMLWQTAKRASVKSILSNVLDSQLGTPPGPAGPSPPAPPAAPTSAPAGLPSGPPAGPAAGVESSAGGDPNFTVG